MKLIVDIPEDVYTRLFDNGIQDNEIAVDDVCEMARAIRKGTPLPKEHGRLIEDNFEVGPVFDEKGNRVGYMYVTQEDLNNAPTIIEADKAESEGI